MKSTTISLTLLLVITSFVWAIPPEFNLREDDKRNDFPNETRRPTDQGWLPHPMEYDYTQPDKSRRAYDNRATGEDPEDQPEYLNRVIPNLKEQVVPSNPDGIMLHPTDLQITPQRPRHLPERPRRPVGTPPPPLPQYQEDRQSASPH